MKDNFMNENGMATEWMNVENRAFRICFGNTGEWNKGLCEFGRKLLCAADLLSAREFLGLELSVDSEGNCGGYVFSNAKEGMTAEDCQWFFLGLADIAKIAETDGKVGKPSGEQDHVYRMSEVSASELEGNEALRQKISEMKGACARRKEQDQEDLVQMLQKTGARLFMIFNAQGMRFFVRTQSGMSLGMRTLLTFLFPGNVIEEVSGSVPAKERATFSRNSALDMTAGFLELFARRQFEKNRQTDYWDDSQDFEFTDDIDDFEIMDEADCCDISDDPDDYVPIGDPEDSGSQACSSSGADEKDQKDDGAQDGPSLDDSMTIDELELTVRSYNCLRRAGIDTIGELRQMTDEDLQHVRNLGRKGISEIRERLAQYGIQTQSRALTVVNKSSFEMLDELIGLDAVKEQVRKIVAYARMKHDMEERFLGNGTSIVLNMEFVGNPGTAKTTVARIVAGILHETGLLRYKDIVEVGRADLVAKYVGQTADKVRDAFRRAQGKVLFIDEAYSLLEEHEGSFGDEAIATIVQEMENHRRETVVIFAGYPKEMADFIGRNPGLRSRVPFRIEFQDYSAEEMAQIAEHETKGRGFCIAPEAMEKVLSICAENSGNIELGNGRFSRNLVEGAILNYAARVYGTDGADNEIQSDFVLREEDFSTQNLLETKKTVKPLGFIA